MGNVLRMRGWGNGKIYWVEGMGKWKNLPWSENGMR